MFFKISYMCYLPVCVHMEVRGQYIEVGPLLHPGCLRDRLRWPVSVAMPVAVKPSYCPGL